MTIGEKIIFFRNKRNLSQNQLAIKAGIKQGMLSQIESGKKKLPTFSTLQKIADALEISVAEFDDNSAMQMTKTLYPSVMRELDALQKTKEEQVAYEIIKKMPPDERQQRLLKVVEKYKRLSASDQEALARLIDSLPSSRK